MMSFAGHCWWTVCCHVLRVEWAMQGNYKIRHFVCSKLVN